jgi:hypothetical protein
MPMGYKMVNGEIEIQEDHAKTVKSIFTDYIAGKSMKAIAKDLTAKGVLNANNKPSWNHGSVGKILQNVKYQGDEYYPRLVDEAIFNKAQERRLRVENELSRTQKVHALRNQTVFSGMIRCGECGENYKKYIEHAGKPSEKVKWKCKHYIYQNRVLCRNHFFTDDDLKEIFIEATNQLLRQRWLIEKIKLHEPPKMSMDLRETENRIKELEQEGDCSNPELPELIMRRAQLYYAGAKVYDQPQNAKKLKEALAEISTLTEFDEELFKMIIKQMTIYKETKIAVEFIGGIIIERPIETKRKDGNHGSSKKDGSNHTASNEI